jgi:uncharacterized protein YjiS (DUF1127 family)
MATISLPRTGAASAASARPWTLAGIAARIAAAIRGRRALGELAQLDPHILADIGLTRSDVIAAFERPLAEDPTLYLARVARRRGPASF